MSVSDIIVPFYSNSLSGLGWIKHNNDHPEQTLQLNNTKLAIFDIFFCLGLASPMTIYHEQIQSYLYGKLNSFNFSKYFSHNDVLWKELREMLRHSVVIFSIKRNYH